MKTTVSSSRSTAAIYAPARKHTNRALANEIPTSLFPPQTHTHKNLQSAPEHPPKTLAGLLLRLTATTRCTCSPQLPITPYKMRIPLSFM